VVPRFDRVTEPIPTASPKWLVWWRHEERPALRLVCIGQAGAGAAAFRRWGEWIPAGLEPIAVRLPGRESRLRERPIDDVGRLVDELVPHLEPLLDEPLALFGHCAGALIAFELARGLRRLGLPSPVRLLVASQAAPSVKEELRDASNGVRLDLRTRLERLGGTDATILRNPALVALLEPAIAADFRLSDEYRYRPEAPLELPIDVFAGAGDEHLDEGPLLAWREETSSDFELTVLDADHFFTGDAWRALAVEVGKRLVR
jgi:medium-chain acyl-[acyl-carrier-protein] hydrolase